MTSRQKKILVFILSLLAVSALIIFLASKRASITNLRASDLVAANMRFTPELNNSNDKELLFFTGSSIASLNLTNTSDEFVGSEALIKDNPLGNTDRLSRGESLTIFRSYHYPDDTFLATNTPLDEGWTWFMVDDDSKVSPLPLLSQSSIADCIIEGDTIYALVKKPGGQSLVSFKSGDSQTTTLVDEHPSTSFVGRTSGLVITRDYDGNIYSYTADNKSIKEVAKRVGESAFDEETKKLVTTGLSVDTDNEGEATDNSDTTPLTILDLSNGHKESTTMTGGLFFISRGYLLIPNSASRPTRITIRDLRNNQERTFEIDQSQTKVSNPVSELVVVNKDLSVIAAITNHNYLQLYGKPDYVNKLPVYKLPLIDSRREDYIFDHDIASGRLSIYAYDQTPSVIDDTISVLKSTCECDVNQLTKSWGIVPDSPGL